MDDANTPYHFKWMRSLLSILRTERASRRRTVIGPAGRIGLSLGFVATVLALGASTPVCAADPQFFAPADTVFQKGFVYTVDRDNTIRQAIAIRGRPHRLRWHESRCTPVYRQAD